jgi:transposase
MIDVIEVLRRWQRGQSSREIERAGVADRKTAARYIAAAKDLGVDEKDELTDEIVRVVALQIQERPKLEPSEQWSALETQRVRIQDWLARKPRPMKLTRILVLLKRDGVDVSYTTLRRFAHKELGFNAPKSTVRLDDPPPGEEAQIDFGHVANIEVDGKRRRLWALIVVLTYSRNMFVYPTLTQTVDDVCAGLDAAWNFFEGVVARIVPDNASSMIIRADPKYPVLHRSFAEYVQARNLLVDPARVETPQDKARVENQVPFVRESCFDGETILSVHDAQQIALTWCNETAGARIHGTTRRVPLEHYAAEERAHMQPAPAAPFDVPKWLTAKVHPDHHIQVQRALYSAPTTLLHKDVDVRIDRKTVKVYFKHELVKVHPRQQPGGRSTDPSHYPTGKADYAMRNVDAVKQRAAAKGASVGALAAQLLGGPLPWTKMRQAYGLLRLCERYGDERVDVACARALAFDVTDVQRIERMLKLARAAEEAGEASGRVVPMPSRFARDSSSFATKVTSTNGGGAQ